VSVDVNLFIEHCIISIMCLQLCSYL